MLSWQEWIFVCPSAAELFAILNYPDICWRTTVRVVSVNIHIQVETEWVNPIDGITIGVGVKVYTPRLANRVHAQPPPCLPIISPIQREVKAGRGVVKVAGESEVTIKVAGEVFPDSIRIVIITSSDTCGVVGKLANASQV
jgi:hypothetical protein